ncbi:[citrate (pro-3S)-lyase] ligase [Candidatus Formimonas warabiya]|uniref:[Citrate [pro-3S]-lyase] ligase n=1 Tax=Formimonas warabiya TaxID=1761012 RepID=A0A3G1KUT1_FORW1|nr:[citrate (pro-3S)-lyase] ligase [Candidatus Formimonas warabiya]ATW26196.1 [citrate (pro-3S)-lyase] ligase [Candidatus Formimonas warabiya]
MEYLMEEVLKPTSQSERERLGAFLKKQGLTVDQDLEYSMVLTDGGRIVAAGSFAGRVLKCIAVDEAYQGRGLSARVITHLVNEQYQRGRTHLFIYTKPENKLIFSELGFYPVAEVPMKVVLMENRRDGIKKYLEEVSAGRKKGGLCGAIVVNCNPFTLGHQYLIEYAAARCDILDIFVLWEDRSSFPSEVRYRLVQEGVRHIPHAAVHKGKDYIISEATFPSYFIKEYQDYVETHAKLDITVFAEHIGPALGIVKRFVGEEPYCPVTSVYNRIMKEMLPAKGIDVEVVPRVSHKGKAISASRVRELIQMGEMDEVKELVPETTYHYLLSDEAKEVIKKIQSKNTP